MKYEKNKAAQTIPVTPKNTSDENTGINGIMKSTEMQEECFTFLPVKQITRMQSEAKIYSKK